MSQQNPRVKNREVIRLWRNGERAQNHRNSLYSLSGGSLYSYGLKIGHRTKSGACIVADYTAATKHYKSQTTSCHVGIARGVADLIMHPAVWETSPLCDEPLPF